jgi:serine/threonine protein kinase/tetratricopeptide (TPR) repeat protein
MTLAAGTWLGSYEILSPLGAGGMGEVYRAKDRELGREVALKVLSESVARDPELVARFRREAIALAALNHPRIATLFSFESAIPDIQAGDSPASVGTGEGAKSGEPQGQAEAEPPNATEAWGDVIDIPSRGSSTPAPADPIPFLVMELVGGETLAERLQSGPVPIEEAIPLFLQIIEGVEAAHGQGVVHRDLKPSNIKFSADCETSAGRVKILDFGLAKALSPEASKGAGDSESPTQSYLATRRGEILGTVAYMSPEQARGEPVDERSDLFSLGVMFYEMATGRRPFAGDSAADIIKGLLADSPSPPSELVQRIDPELDRIIMGALEKDRKLRCQSAAEMRAELQRLVRDTSASSPLEALQPPPRRVTPSSRRAWMGISIVIALLAAGGWWLVHNRSSSPPIDSALTPTTPSPESVATQPGPPSIAVLPFVNMSDDPENEYFSDGLSEELLNALARIEGLRVAARTSSFRFKGETGDITEIGRQLKVGTLLEGSVRKAGNRLRITAQLIDTANGFHLWSETYDRELEDIFAVQDDIAGAVVEALRVTLLGSTTVVPDSRSKNVAAYNLYLKGRYLSQRQGREDWNKAVEHYEAALALDQNYALAWAGLAQVLQSLGGQSYRPLDEAVVEARAAVDRALEIDKNLVEGWVTLSSIREENDWDWAGADEAIQKARELDPRNPEVLRRLASQLGAHGRLEESIKLNRQTVELDPLNPRYYQSLSFHLLAAGHLEEALAARETILELNPDRTATHYRMGSIRLAMSQPEAALEEVKLEIEPFWRLVGLAITHHALGNMDEAQAALLELLETHAKDGAFQIAEVYSCWGETDEAFEWLQRAYEQRDPGLTDVKITRTLVNLHDDPRWPVFLEKMGLDD